MAKRYADLLDGLDRGAADKGGQAAKEGLFSRREKIVTPDDGVAHGLEPRGLVARAAGQHRQLPIQALQQSGWRQERHPSRGQLNRQWQAVNPPADGRDRRCVGRGQRERWFRGGCLRQKQ